MEWSKISNCSLALRFTSNGQEQLELWWKLIFSVESVWEIDSPDSAVGMNLNSQGLYVVGTVRSPCEIWQVELNLVPALIQSHRHRTNEWLYTGSRLIVWCTESSPDTLVIQDLDLECEIFLQVLDDHDKEGKLDGERLLWIKRSIDVISRYIGTHNLKNRWLNVRISDSFDVTVPHALIPNLQRLGSKLYSNS